MQSISPVSGRQLPLVQLAGRLRRALRLFRQVTGQTAVMTVAPSLPEPGTPFVPSPPVHPHCARKLRSISRAPCGDQWLRHVRTLRRSLRSHTHTCPIGLRCSCVPIHLGDRLVGVTKLVARADAPEPVFKNALRVLKLALSETCHDSTATVLSEEVLSLRRRVGELQQLQNGVRPRLDGSSVPRLSPDAQGTKARQATLVDRAIAHLQRSYPDPGLSLRTVAAALGCNPRYLTTRFTQVVGEHLHTYLIRLRVSNACRLLIGSDFSIKEIAHLSGFSGPGRLAGAFQTHIGVTPTDYRRIFAAP